MAASDRKSEQEDHDEYDKRSFKYKLVKNIFLFLSRVFMGMYLEISGPTLLDLKDRVGVNYEEISRVLVAKSVGYFISSVFGGFLVDKLKGHVDLLIALGCLLGAAGTAIIPWSPSMPFMGVMFHLQGLGEGIIDVGGDNLVIRMWGNKAASPIHSLHFAFGIGALIAPQLARPFLSFTAATNNSTMNTTDTTYTLKPIVLKPSTIEIPYLIIGLLTFSICLVFVFYYFKDRKLKVQSGSSDNEIRKQQSVLQIINPRSCAGGKFLFGFVMFCLLFVYYFLVVGGERALSKFLFAFATDGPLKFSKDSATILNTVFWASFTTGRGLAMLSAKFVGPRILLIVELILNLVVAIVLLTLGYRFTIVMWIFTALQGACLSPLFPSGIAWANIYLKITGMALAVFYIGASFGGMAFQWVTGYFFQNYGPMSWLYIILVYAIAVNVIFWAMQVIAWKFGTVITRKDSLEESAHEVNAQLNHPMSNTKDTDVSDDDEPIKAIKQTDHSRL